MENISPFAQQLQQVLFECQILQRELQFFNDSGNLEDRFTTIFQSYNRLPTLNKEFHNCLTSNGPNFNASQIRSCQLLQQVFDFLILFIGQMRTNPFTIMIQQIKTDKFILMKYICHVEVSTPILKEKANFSASFRCLYLDQMNLTERDVNCCIVSAKHILALQQELNPYAVTNGLVQNIHNSRAILRYQDEKLCANFSDMKLIEVVRFERQGFISEEKCVLLFYTTISVNEQSMYIWALSKPVIQITHSSQEKAAEGTLFWLNSFPEVSMDPFRVTETVQCHDLLTALVREFETRTNRQLSNINLEFIQENLLELGSEGNITRTIFFKTPWRPRNSFWIWFQTLMKLLMHVPNVDSLDNSSIQAIWQAGLITGFISKDKAAEFLRDKDVGSFLIRFSESNLNSLNVVFKKSDNSIEATVPWEPRVVEVNGLANLIFGIPGAQFLYSPFIPTLLSRDDAFRQRFRVPPIPANYPVVL